MPSFTSRTLFWDTTIVIDFYTEHPTTGPMVQSELLVYKDREFQRKLQPIPARAHFKSLLDEPYDIVQHSTNVSEAKKMTGSPENALTRQQLPADFSEKLTTSVFIYDSDDNGDIMMAKAPLQANPCNAQSAVGKSTTSFLDSDTGKKFPLALQSSNYNLD